MNIQVTPLAERKLTERLGGKPGFLKLLFVQRAAATMESMFLIASSFTPGSSKFFSKQQR